MNTWAPQPPALQEILQTIHDSTDTQNPQIQRSITHVRPLLHSSLALHFLTLIPFISQKLNNFTRAPDYVAYLAYILASMPQEEDRIRTIAGYLLKNNCRLILRASSDVIAFVKAAILLAFNDSAVMIRNAAGQDIVAFLGILEPRNWPECLQQLVNTLDSPNPDQQEVSISFHLIFDWFHPQNPSSAAPVKSLLAILVAHKGNHS